jgi:ankyrin repeat protein
VTVSSTKGFTPLLLAARNGDVELARLLISAGADVNQLGSDGTHALPLAIISGQDQFALFLIDQGADPNATLAGVPALHAAAGDVGTWLGDWYRVHGRSRAVDAGGRGLKGLTPEQRLPLVNALLARGADPNGRVATSAVVLGYIGTTRYGVFEQNAVGTGDVRGATPLWVAGKSSNGGGLQGVQGPTAEYRYDSSPDIISTLLEAGADPNLTTDDGTTPLMMAAGLGVRSHQPLTARGVPSPPAEEAVRVLVEAGAEVNATNHGDFTALHGATFRGLNEVIQYLVEQGADINARDYRGRTAYRMAEGAKQSFQYQAFPETAEFLRGLGANTRLGIPGTIHERADRVAVGGTGEEAANR